MTAAGSIGGGIIVMAFVFLASNDVVFISAYPTYDDVEKPDRFTTFGESITITCRDVPLHLAKMFMEQVRNIQNRNEEQHDRNLYSHRSTGSMATGGDYINNSDEDNDHRCSIFGQSVADTCRHLQPRLANRFIREVRKIQNNIESEAESKPCVRCSRFHMG